MRIGAVIYPLLAVCLAAYGGYRALVGRFMFVRRMGGRAMSSHLHMYTNYACRTYHYQLYMLKDGSVRKYFDMSEIVLPSIVPPAYVVAMGMGITEQYRGMLRGWNLMPCMNVPGYAKYIAGREAGGIGIWRAKPEYTFGAYCKDYGVPYSKLKGAMDDLRGQLYVKLIEAGYIKEKDMLL